MRLLSALTATVIICWSVASPRNPIFYRGAQSAITTSTQETKDVTTTKGTAETKSADVFELEVQTPARLCLNPHNLRIKFRLEYVVHSLKSFFQELAFDFKGFGKQAKYLAKILSEIDNLIESENCSEEFSEPYRFVKQIFEALFDGAYFLNFFSLRVSEQRVVRGIIQVNLRLLELHDFQGIPDPQKEEFEEEVKTLSNYIPLWWNELTSLGELPQSIRVVLEKQYWEAQCILRMLESKVPIHRKGA
ncbi:hypothetical protein JCM33374_g4289 [Metschnikowia sp. JCM 33374]|nr:hypothetical protein JCM33374_g4289 [Metschnikowia sp. JCM 33374]